MVDLTSLALAWVCCYLALILILNRLGLLRRWGFKLYGPALMLRKQLGPEFLSGISRFRIWNWMARLGVGIFLACMWFSFWILIVGLIHALTHPLPPISPRELFLIPGVNPWIPLIWGLPGIGIAVLIHEFGHGILCKLERIKLKSMGLIIFFFPLGAFAEPDPVFLKLARTSSKLKVLAMGATANLILAGICLGGFYGILTQIQAQYPTAWIVLNLAPNSIAAQIGIQPGDAILELNSRSLGSLQEFKLIPGTNNLSLVNSSGIQKLYFDFSPIPGLEIIYVEPHSPGWRSNLTPGMRLISLDGIQVRDYEHFHQLMANTSPGQQLKLQIWDAGQFRDLDLILDRSPYFQEPRGFIGVLVENIPIGAFAASLNSSRYLDEIKQVFQGLPALRSILLLLGLPALEPYPQGGFRGFSGSMFWELYQPKPLLILAELLFWIGWINLIVGVFNTLPGLPLDGGHFFKGIWDEILARLNPKWMKYSTQICIGMGILVWSALMLMIMLRLGFRP